MKRTNIILQIIILLLIGELAFAQAVSDSVIIDDYLIYTDSNSNLYNYSLTTPTLSTQESQGNDIWLGGQDAGIMPLDIIYIDSVNKFFVYGYHRIIVLNGTTHQKEGVIDISNYGTSFFTQIDNYGIEDNNNFAYNPIKNQLYCVTEDLKIIAIDPNQDQVLFTIKQGDTYPKYDFKSLKYDSRTDKIVLVTSGFNMGTGIGTHYYTFYGNDYQTSSSRTFSFFTYSFAINKDRDVVYLSVKKNTAPNNFIQLRNIDGNTLLKEQNVGDAPQGKLLYINNTTNSIHKLFSFPVEHSTNNYTTGYAIDGTTDVFQSFSVSNFINSSTYNPDNNKVYCAYPGGVYVYNASNNNLEAQITIDENNFLTKSFSLSYNGQNKIIGGIASDFNRKSYSDGAYSIDCNTNEVTLINAIPNAYNIKAARNNANTTLLISATDCSVFEISPNGSYLGKTDLGGRTRKIIYNSVENKVYSYDPHIGKIYINDLDDNSSTTIDLGLLPYPNYISSIVFDKKRNKVYVAIYENDNKIRIIDGSTNQLLNDVIETSTNWIKQLFVGENDRLYCTVGGGTQPLRLYFIDLNTNDAYQYKILSSVVKWNYNAWFALTKTKDLIVAVNNPKDATNKIRVIDPQNGTFLETYIVTNPIGLAYNPLNNKIYSGSINEHGTRKSITVIDRSTGQVNYYSLNKDFMDIQYCDKGNYLAVLTAGNFNYLNPEPASIIYFDGTSNDMLSSLDVPSWTSCIKYNPVNGNLYAIIGLHYGSYGNNRAEVWNFNHFYGINSYVVLNMYETHFYEYISSKDQAVINTNDNQLIITTSCHSKLNVIQLEDEMLKVNGNDTYTWISYPKLERDETTDQPQLTRGVMEDIDPIPYKLELTYRMPPPFNMTYRTFSKEGNNWNESDLPYIQSTKGYKLNIHQAAESWLLLYGTRLAPDYSMQLKAGGKNWIGYFLLQNQSPMDALSQLLPDQLVSAKGHDWTLVDLATGPGDHHWKLTPEDAVIKYGDMVVVEVANDINIFEWYGFGNIPTEVDRTPQNFTYEEKADYTSLLIEPDTNNRPQEIGAFLDDTTCIGACVVFPTDTTVLLKSYDEGYAGDSIVFHMYYGTKSTGLKTNTVEKYYVFNKERGVNEQRIVKTGEHKKFYLISFNNKNKRSENFDESNLQCTIFPNPVNSNSKLVLSLENSTNVFVTLYDQTGKVMEKKTINNLSRGKHSLSFNSLFTTVSHCYSGVYFVIIIADNKISTKKILIINN